MKKKKFYYLGAWFNQTDDQMKQFHDTKKYSYHFHSKVPREGPNPALTKKRNSLKDHCQNSKTINYGHYENLPMQYTKNFFQFKNRKFSSEKF